MKKSKKILFKITLIVGFMFSIQFSFAGEIVIRKDNTPPPTPGQTNGMTTLYPVSAMVDTSVLSVYFDQSVGDATITVYNQANELLYVTIVNTDADLEKYIPIGTWASGNYIVRIHYGTTYLIGEFGL